MDTVEELNGTYFYKGVCNISASELFFWIFLDATVEQFGGLKDAVMMTTMILGLPILETRTKPETVTIGTSVASKYLRDQLNVQLPYRLPTIALASFKYRKPMYTINLGAFIGRFEKEYLIEVNTENYFPWTQTWFFRKWFTKEPVKQISKPLTVRMFAEAVKAGKWIHD